MKAHDGGFGGGLRKIVVRFCQPHISISSNCNCTSSLKKNIKQVSFTQNSLSIKTNLVLSKSVKDQASSRISIGYFSFTQVK